MRGGPRILVVLVAVVVVCVAVDLDAQRRGFSGGASKSVPGLGTRRPTPPDPSDARLLPPAEFKQFDVHSRRRIMMAWAYGSPDKAGAAILPLIEAGLKDEDKDVRQHAVATLRRVQNEASWALATKQPVITNPSEYPSLSETLLQLLDDPDPYLRGEVVTALAALAVPPTEALEGVLLSRLVKEAPFVRARMVRALTERARSGSSNALAAVLSALEDADSGVRDNAVSAMRYLRAPEALPVLLREMVLAREPWMRKAVVQVLMAYGELTKPYVSMVRESLTREADPDVRDELERLVARLERNP